MKPRMTSKKQLTDLVEAADDALAYIDDDRATERLYDALQPFRDEQQERRPRKHKVLRVLALAAFPLWAAPAAVAGLFYIAPVAVNEMFDEWEVR